MRAANIGTSCSALLICTAQAWAVLNAESFIAIRLIEGPYEELKNLNFYDSQSLDPKTVYRTGGISNDGDLFGDSRWPPDDDATASNHPNHFEQGVRWLRSTGYQPEIVNGGQEHLLWDDSQPDQAVPGEGHYGMHSGWHRESPGYRHRGVTPDGIAVGAYNVFPLHSYHYDIKNDVLTDLGKGMGSGANINGLVTAIYSTCCGAHGNGFYSKLLSIDPAQTNDKHEVVSWFPTFGNDVFPWAINNQNIIVGNSGSLFTAHRQPMKILPTGENTWGPPIALESLDNTTGEGGRVIGDSSVLDISNNEERPFGVGISGSPHTHGIVWDINTGTIAADFGPLTQAWQISGDGTKVAGLKKAFAIPPITTPTVWSTDNGWQTFTELDLNETLAFSVKLDGADAWMELVDIDGVNDSGQVVGIGFAHGPNESVSQAVFLLDTLPLGLVLQGDVNNDASVNNLDITPFIAALAAEDEAAFLVQFPEGNYAAADIDISGSPDNLDITPFIGLLTAAADDAAAIPEPSSIGLIVLLLMTLGSGRRWNSA